MVTVDAPQTGVTVYLVFCVYLTECFYVCLFYISLLLFPYVFCLNLLSHIFYIVCFSCLMAQ